ncbi:MAG: type II toxin-antitoxin system HicA family toxin [candidate division NC10 bacterium]
MGRLRVLSGREGGSHMVMQRRTPEGTVTVPVPDHRELALGTVVSIIRQSRVPREEFEA